MEQWWGLNLQEAVKKMHEGRQRLKNLSVEVEKQGGGGKRRKAG